MLANVYSIAPTFRSANECIAVMALATFNVTKVEVLFFTVQRAKARCNLLNLTALPIPLPLSRLAPQVGAGNERMPGYAGRVSLPATCPASF